MCLCMIDVIPAAEEIIKVALHGFPLSMRQLKRKILFSSGDIIILNGEEMIIHSNMLLQVVL